MDTRPIENEYNPYYKKYVNLVPNGDIESILNEQIKETVNLLQNISEEQAHFKYAPEKWSIKEVLGHVADTERIMIYRLLCIARGETVSLPGYDDQEYVANASFNRLSIQEHLENLQLVRQSTVLLLKSLDQEAWSRRGNANNSEVTVRAITYIIAGHERHHRNLINERYMGSDAYPSIQ